MFRFPLLQVSTITLRNITIQVTFIPVIIIILL